MRRASPSARSGMSPLLPLGIMLAVFGAAVFYNAQQAAPPPALGVPTQVPPTETLNPITVLLRDGLSSTALPTVALPTLAPTVPQIAVVVPAASPIAAGDVASSVEDVAQPQAPTSPPPTAQATMVVVEAVARSPLDWRPPPLIPPLSRDPLGRDHYWLRRPIDSNGRNWILESYPYGSDGSDKGNPLRVHHGVDMPNPIGEIVRAAGSGTVIWSADGRQENVDIFQNSPSYGNVIVIEHDFGYQGLPIWTLYAHLSASFVQVGQVVAAGEPIGQVGISGRVSGPHVHFEVRVGQNRYGSTYNPILWMVPFVGHGVIAGRVVDENDRFIIDADITIRNWATGLITTTTTSYVFLNSGFDVNSDPIWRENFAAPDIPVGRYDVITTINGQRVVRQVQVVEGTTAFVELKVPVAALPTPESPENGE